MARPKIVPEGAFPEQPRIAATAGLEDRNPAAAAFIAAGIGVATMGLLQFIGALNESFNESLVFVPALGPYSGKYIISYLVWLVSWAILYPITRAGRISIRTSLIVTGILIIIAAVILFPPFIGLFIAE